MNINGSSLLTLLSGAAGAEGLNALNAESLGASDFAQTLMIEIGQLQNIGIQEQMPSLDKLPDDSLQDIAALLGNKLPVTAKLDQDIDLEETLTALKEVLQHIDAATASEPVQRPGPSQLIAQENKQDQEEMEGLLRTLAENQDNPAYAAVIPSTIESMEETGLDLGQENGIVQADKEKNGQSLLQRLIESGKGELAPKAPETDVKIPVAQNHDDAKITELPAEAAEKTEILAEKFSRNITAWEGGKKLVGMGADIVPLAQADTVERKIEIPAMTKPFAHPEWNQELGERILWMNNKTVPFAELRLNPQHLGPVSIRIDMEQDQARIAFSAQQAAVRDAIEAAVPKLREMLGAQQLNLAEVNVSQPSAFDQGKSPGFGQMAQQQQGDGGQKRGDGAGALDHSNPLADITEVTDGARGVVSNGLLNLFA